MKFWSFSRLIEYERCPHTQSFPYRYRESAPTAQAGIDAHKVCENYLKGFLLRPVDALIPASPYPVFPFEDLGKKLPIPEYKLGLDENWEQVDYKDAWLKLILDAFLLNPTTIIDYKNGRREYNDVKHTQQMQLYACAVDAIYTPPEVRTELWYLGEGHTKTAIYTPEKLAILRPKFHARAERMLNDETLSPKPSKSNCRWCSHKDICEYAFEP